MKLVVGRPRPGQRRLRPRRYDQEVLVALQLIWYVFDCMCSKLLVVVLRTMLPMLESFGEIRFTPSIDDDGRNTFFLSIHQAQFMLIQQLAGLRTGTR